MKKTGLLFCFCLLAFAATAQFTFSGYGTVGYNAAPFFKNFRNSYNETNAADLKSKLGNPAYNYGYSAVLGYRLLKMSTSVGRTQLTGRTQAKFANNAKRIIEFQYKFTTANIGYYHPSEKNEWVVEFGLLHSWNSYNSYVILPNKEVDHFTGISQRDSWAEIGVNLRFELMHHLNDYLQFDFMLQGFYVKNTKEVAPRIKYFDTEATLSYMGLTASAGITLKLGEYID